MDRDPYRLLTEKEAKTLIAPLAAAIMQSTPSIKEMIELRERMEYPGMKLLEQYEGLINTLYQSFRIKHYLD